jgi:16S rRNA (uracil1498-N3)-methyltransferase
MPRRFILDATGEPLAGRISREETAIAVGPEGGFESAELEGAVAGGWVPVSLGATTLRFETAIIAAAAVIRAGQFSQGRT